MAKLDVSSDKDSWGHALVRIKKFCEEEIRTIYSDVFGIDRKFWMTRLLTFNYIFVCLHCVGVRFNSSFIGWQNLIKCQITFQSATIE